MAKEQDELDILLRLYSEEWQKFISQLPSSEDFENFLKPLTDMEFWAAYEDSRK